MQTSVNDRHTDIFTGIRGGNVVGGVFLGRRLYSWLLCWIEGMSAWEDFAEMVIGSWCVMGSWMLTVLPPDASPLLLI